LAKPNVWEVARRKEGTFDILHKGKLLRAEISDKWLEDELGRFAFCGEEYRDIRRQLEESDKAQIFI
jgi:hypothetical protein